MAVAPHEIEGVPADNRKVTDFDFLRHGLRLQGPFASPFVHALCARTSASQGRRIIGADAPVGPGNSQLSVALLRNLCGLDLLAALLCCGVNHAFCLTSSFTFSSAASTAGALTLLCDASQSRSSPRTIKTCGVSCDSPNRRTISSETARAFCTITIPTGCSTSAICR